MRTALEGYEVKSGTYGPLEFVERPGRGKYLRSRVLGLDLRTQRSNRATVVVFADPLTGEEFDGSIEKAEQGRQIAEQRASAAASRAAAAEDRAAAAEERARIAEESMRALSEKLRNRTGRTGPPGRDS